MSELSLLERINRTKFVRTKHIRINKDNKPLKLELQVLDTDAIKSDLTQTMERMQRGDLDDVPRDTLFKLVTERNYDEHFTFKVIAGGGDNYIQAMRQVLVRLRRKALRKKQRLQEFKLLVISVKNNEDHDEVTVMRARNVPQHMESLYDNLMNAMKKE